MFSAERVELSLDLTCFQTDATNLNMEILIYDLSANRATCSVVVKLMDLDPQGRWSFPGAATIRYARLLGPLSKALNPTLPPA